MAGPHCPGLSSPEGYYLHLDFRTSQRGRVAHLLSSPIWVQGPLCVHFAYYMFGLTWGAQLKLLQLTGTESQHPDLLWKHINIQTPSWMPTTVTVPKGHVLPIQVRPRAEPGDPLGILVSGVGGPGRNGDNEEVWRWLGQLNSGSKLGA